MITPHGTGPDKFPERTKEKQEKSGKPKYGECVRTCRKGCGKKNIRERRNCREHERKRGGVEQVKKGEGGQKIAAGSPRGAGLERHWISHPNANLQARGQRSAPP